MERVPDNRDLVFKRSLGKPFELKTENSEKFFVAGSESARRLRLIDGES